MNGGGNRKSYRRAKMSKAVGKSRSCVNEKDDDSDFENINDRTPRRTITPKRTESSVRTREIKRIRSGAGTSDKESKVVAKKVRHPKQKNTSTDVQAIVAHQPKIQRNESNGIRLRTTPYPLFNAVMSMSIDQLNCMDDMGFSGLVGMKLDGIPAALGLHVALNFDQYTMSLKTANGEIKITGEKIKEVLGAPMGPLRYESCVTRDYGLGIRAEWMKQFNKEVIRPTDVSREIMLSNLADWNFKLNFLVVFCNTMAKCKYNGLCELSVLSMVTPETRIRDINWCGYVYNCLKYSKNTWTGENLRAYYCGPLATLVLLYVDNIKFDIPRVRRLRPVIRGWSSDMLRVRMEYEIEAGGLGLGELTDPYEAEVEDVEEQTSKSPESVEVISVTEVIICETILMVFMRGWYSCV